MGAGFDGTYLDDIDGYQQFNLDGDGTRPSAALEMILFIQQLSSWVKAQKPDFLVFPQNAEGVYQDALENLDENGDLRLDASDPFITVVNGVVFLDVDDDEAFSDGDISLASMDTNNDGALSGAEIANTYFNSIDGLGAEDFFSKAMGKRTIHLWTPWVAVILESLTSSSRVMPIWTLRPTMSPYLTWSI